MSRPPEVFRGCPRRRTQACVLRTEHARGFPGRRQGRETWRGQCRAGEEEGGADRGSTLSWSLPGSLFTRQKLPCGGGEPGEDPVNGGHPPGSAYPSPAERSLGAEGRPWTLRRRNSKYTRGRGSTPFGLRSSACGRLYHLPHPSWPLSWHLFWPLGSPTPAHPWGGLLDTREGGA